MSKKVTLKHAQPNGEIVTRQTARAYSHVLLRKVNVAARLAEIEGRRAASLEDTEKSARKYYKQYLAEVAAGVGGQIPYWPGQGGYRKLADGSLATHTLDQWQYDNAAQKLAEFPSIESYVAHNRAVTEAEIARNLEQVRGWSEEWEVISWHGRADLAKPSYVGAGDTFMVEAVNNGSRP
jgi:hypothetical protein